MPRDIADTSATPEEELQRKSREKLLQEALSQLEEKHREILILFDIQGLPQAEISTLLSPDRFSGRQAQKSTDSTAHTLGGLFGHVKHI